MKGCSALLIIRKMQLKTTMRYCFTPVQMAIIKKSTNNRYWWGCGRKGTLLHCWASQVVLVVKNFPASAADARDAASVPQLGKSPGIGNGTPLQCSCRGKFPGQRRLVGYSPWGCRESDMTERLSTRPYTVVRNVSCAAKRSDHVAVGQSLSRVWLFWPRRLHHVRPPCPSLSPRVCSDSCSLNQWCYLTTLSSAPLLLLPTVFPIIRVFSSESAVYIRWPKHWSFSNSPSSNTQGWFPLGLTGLISLQSKGLLQKVF